MSSGDYPLLFEDEDEDQKRSLILFTKQIAELEKGCAPSVGLTEQWILQAREILSSMSIKFKTKEGY